MKRVNVRLLLILVATLAALATGTFFLNKFQVARNAGSLVTLARQRLEEGKTNEALGLFTRYLGLRPEDTRVQAEFAELILERAMSADATQADLQRAYNALEEAVRENPDDDGLRLKLARFQVQVGRFSDAREHLDLLASRPAKPQGGPDADGDGDQPEPIDPVEIQMLLARAYAGEGEFEKSAELAGELVGYDVKRQAFDPDKVAAESTDAYILLASLLQDKLADQAAADAVLEELGKRRKDDARAWLAISRWHRQQGDLEAATADIGKAQALAADDINVVWGAFELALAKGDLPGAEVVAKRARELFPSDERVYRGLASIALQRGALPEAEQVLRDGVAMLPNKASLLLMLADTLLQEGKLEETEQALARIEELYGKNSPAVGLLQARLLIARRRWSQARQKLEQVRPIAVGVPDLIRQIDLCLSQCYENLGDFDEQLDVSRRILVDDPSSLAARTAAAAALASSGRANEALAEFETVAGSLPPDRLAAVPQVWYPLLQLRVLDQLDAPATERDWSKVDALVAALEESASISPSQIALLRADILARKGESDAAIDLLDQASGEPGAQPQLWSALATLVLRERGAEAAAGILARVPKELAGNPALLMVRAQLAAGGPPEERAATLAAIEKQSADVSPEEAAQVLSALAALQMNAGDEAEAERLWKAAAERQPDDLRSRSALLEMAMKQGNVEKARAAAADIEAVAGAGNARALVAKAGVRILEVRSGQQGREQRSGKIELDEKEEELLDEARNLLIEAENDRPGWQMIQAYAAEVEGLRGNIPGAIDHLQRSLRIGPSNPQIVRQLVALLYATNRLDEARKALDSLGPDGLAGFERLSAEMELRSGRLDEAVALAERTVAEDSANAGELLWLGQLLERSGKSERAGETFERATAADPSRADAWLALFSHQLATGRRRSAERALDRAVDALAEPARTLVLAQCSEQLGRLDDADRAFQEAVAAAPDDMGVATARAEFLVRCGRIGDAREALRRIVDMPASDDATSRVTKAWARRKLAELVAGKGSYPDLRDALALIDANANPDGSLPPEDAAARITLLANRPEPESWQAAIKTIETLRERQPLTTGQRLTLAGLLDKAGRWNECRQELMSVVSAPKTPPAFVGMLVDKLISHGELDNARAWLKRLQTAAPGAPVTLALEARMAVAEKDRTKAADAARKLMPTGDVPADQAGQLAALARLLEDLGFAKAADKVLEQYASLSPDGVIARADFLGRQGRGTEALDLLESRWDSLPLERLLGVALAAARNDAAAAARVDAWLTKARRIDPGSVVVTMLEAELRDVQGRRAEAEALYRKLLERRDIEPSQAAIAANNLAFHLAVPDTAAEARKLIDEAIVTIGPHPDLLDTRGMVKLVQGEHTDAVADFEQAVLQPSDVKFLHLAYARLKAGDAAEARKALEAGRKKGLTAARLSAADRARLGELETALGAAPEQAGGDGDAAGGSG